jgi:thiopurine S-methyltransferase
MATLDAKYWQSRWEEGSTFWDMGSPSPALIEYASQLTDKDLRILIPGAGSGYEAAWLHQQGFCNVYVLDFAAGALLRLQEAIPDTITGGFPADHLFHQDFFLHQGQYDLILEQTFFCALPPARRPDYARHMHELLVPGGTLAGLLFDFPLTEQGPPFGGSEAEYRGYFEPYFEVKTLERAYNSIKPRAGSELFMILKKSK